MAIIERAAYRTYGDMPGETILRCAWCHRETLWTLERDAGGGDTLLPARGVAQHHPPPGALDGSYNRTWVKGLVLSDPDEEAAHCRDSYNRGWVKGAEASRVHQGSSAVRSPVPDEPYGVWPKDAAGVEVFTMRAADIYGAGARSKRKPFPVNDPTTFKPAEAFKRRCPLKTCPSHKVDGVTTFAWSSVLVDEPDRPTGS